MPNKRSAENEYRVTGSVLDELGLDRQAALELKLKASLHQNILQLVKRRGHRARDLERILQIQQPRVSELNARQAFDVERGPAPAVCRSPGGQSRSEIQAGPGPRGGIRRSRFAAGFRCPYGTRLLLGPRSRQ
jgi:predicted XRE-type DNA-binding protein